MMNTGNISQTQRRAHIVNRIKLLGILPWMSRFHFAQPEISLNFKLPVVHSIQKSFPFNVPGWRQKQCQFNLAGEAFLAQLQLQLDKWSFGKPVGEPGWCPDDYSGLSHSIHTISILSTKGRFCSDRSENKLEKDGFFVLKQVLTL